MTVLSTRERVRASARTLMIANGYEHTQVAEIMREAGFATGTFYRCYPAKLDLLYEWMEEVEQEIVALLELEFDRTSDGAWPGVLSNIRTARPVVEALAKSLVKYGKENQALIATLGQEIGRIVAAESYASPCCTFAVKVLKHVSGDMQGVLALGEEVTGPVMDDLDREVVARSIVSVWAQGLWQTSQMGGPSSLYVRSMTRNVVGILQTWGVIR